MPAYILFILHFYMIFLSIGFVHADHCSCKTHIFCLYPNPGPGSACKGYVQDYLGKAEKKKALHLLNKFRSRVASGLEELGNPGPQPSASNMLKLSWNSYLEKTSQRYADQCVFAHSPGECRKNDNYHIGENLGTINGEFHPSSYLTFITMWYGEVKDFPSSLVDNYNPPDDLFKKIGHYGQMVNAKTYDVGCARSRWENQDLFVCHFGPAIYSDLPIYTRGAPASQCIDGTHESTRYKGLCSSGEEEDEEEEEEEGNEEEEEEKNRGFTGNFPATSILTILTLCIFSSVFKHYFL